jgi:tetratricopeptide (TPR) repeat protein
MIESSGSNSQNLYTLARFYESQQKWDLAEKIYLQIIDSSSQEEIVPLMNLGAYYNRRNNYDKALEAMEKARAVKTDDLTVLMSIAQLHFDHRHMDESEEIVDKTLEKDVGHIWANFLKGRLYLQRKDFANALERFDFVTREKPRDAFSQYYKALSLLGKGEKELAKQDLLKAVELNPRLLDARLILAEFYLRERDQNLAREQIEGALKLSPRHTRALMLKGNLKILEGDVKSAEATFKEVVDLAPDYVPGYVRLGLLFNLSKRKEDALKSFEKALELDPEQTDALALMVGIYMKDKKYDKAFEICEREKQKIKGKPTQLALIEYLEGGISLAKKDLQKARQHFERAIDTEPNILPPYIALAKVYVQEEELPQAISQYEAIVEKKPNYLAGYMALGTIHGQQGDAERAEAYYRKALEIKRDFAPAANNLAWTLASKGGNIDEALGFAQIAKEQMPKSAAVMDTLGWIYYLKGSYLNAIAEFQDSLAREPDNPMINYHAGLAYYKNNQPDKAKGFLEEALKIDQNFNGAEEARGILKEIEASSASN